ncbi:MAG: HEAT repeat domain-containing protein [Deltaproteobacteria bacterium]|nr:HEAT repeat domain-containing protein [Deltaproteobacteria bacterium]
MRALLCSLFITLAAGVAFAEDLAPEPETTPGKTAAPERPLGEVIILLTASDEATRVGAAEALGKRRAREAITALGKALTSDSAAKVREKAAYALGSIGAALPASERTDIAKALSGAASDASRDVRYMVAWAIGNVRDAAGYSAVAGLVGSDADTGVRARAAWAIGRLGDARGRETLFRALRDATPVVRKEVVKALRALGVDDATIRARTPADDRETPLFGEPKSQTTGVLLSLVPIPGLSLIYAGKIGWGIAEAAAGGVGAALMIVGATGGAFETEGFGSKNPGMKALFFVGVGLAGIAYTTNIIATPLSISAYNDRIEEGRRAEKLRPTFKFVASPFGVGMVGTF